MNRRLPRCLAAMAAFALAGCSAPYLRNADTLSRKGDWETALIEYRRAAEEHPESGEAVHKVKVASEKVAAIWTKRGNDANAQGRLGEAAEWWRKAVELAPADDRPATPAWKAIASNASALEYFGDVAENEGRHEDALSVYSALILVDGQRVDVVQKQLGAQRTYAAELRDEAESLARRNLPGAALVADMRALQHDPLQQNAFTEGNALRRRLRSATRVSIPEVKVDDHGYHALAAAMMPALTAGLDDTPPYGPTRDPDAIKGSFKATIVAFDRHEETVKGQDEVANDEPASTTPIENPAIPEQRKRIGALEAKLAGQKTDLKRATPPRGHRPTDEQRKAGLAAARAVDATRMELEKARAALAALPPTVMPPPPPATWTLPWSETTRSIEATVRFEVTEADFAEPMVVEVTHKVSVTDRTHAGNARHHVAPDPLELPSMEALVTQLAAQFADGTEVLAQAKARRVERLIAQGRQLHQSGSDPEALDAFVAAMFVAGPEALPPDAVDFVSRQLETGELKSLVAAN